ncbi:MAG TPA: ATPase, partial [Casimicrobiaceae bacterium]
MLRTLVVLAVVAIGSDCLAAVDIGANGVRVRHEVVIAASPAKVYGALTGHVDRWWNAQHTYSGDSRNLPIDARAGGCFCEKLSNGSVEHMQVVHARTNEMLRMTGGLGPLQASGVAGAMTWRLSPAQAAT